MSTDLPLVDVIDLEVHFPVRRGLFGSTPQVIRAVDGVSLRIARGETLALVGESGCGKSTTGYALLGMQKPTGGSVTFRGAPVSADGAAARHMQIVFQDPTAALNPRRTVGASIREPLDIHTAMSSAEKQARVAELLDLVGLRESQMNRLPGEFSGGQRQRIVIARALALEPDLVVCDEPVSALDVSIQSQILNLLLDIQQRLGLAYLFISHDLSVVHHIADRVAVMYLGRIVEEGPVEDVFLNPIHPYTRSLLSAVPRPDPAFRQSGQRIVLKGDLPDPANPPEGCRFCTRCPVARNDCSSLEPELFGDLHRAACLYPGAEPR